jgi:hypothetical protein
MRVSISEQYDGFVCAQILTVDLYQVLWHS